MNIRRIILAIAAFSVTAPIFAKSPLGTIWSEAERVSMDRIDHEPFDELLKRHVDVNGYVDYASWQKSRGDRSALLRYLGQLSRVELQKNSSREAQLAFWINAYNAVTIEGILQEYPTDSIRNHTAKLFGYNIWEDLSLIVGAKQYSLEQIEHDILRKMNDPRIHFAIVCASVGCPRLRDEAWTRDRVQEQLDDSARDFFGRSKHLRVSEDLRTLSVSAILDWFADDFGANQRQRLDRIMPWLPERARKAARNPGVVVEYLDYDWSLNDQSRQL